MCEKNQSEFCSGNFFERTELTTPGSKCSISKFGPALGWGVDGGDESDEESGEEGRLLPAEPNFTVNT